MTGTVGRWSSSLLAFLAVSTAVSVAGAFCRTTACQKDCEFEWGTGCELTGLPLYWGRTCVSFGVQEAGSPKRSIDFESARNIIGDAYSQWLAVDCGDGESPGMTISDFGPIACAAAEYNQTAPNANLWVFRDDDDWLFDGEASEIRGSAIALTTINYNSETGEIYDADVEIDSANVEITTSRSEVKYDLASIALHEIGHFLGLSHSLEFDSAMQPEYVRGTILELSGDDQMGMCTIYPPSDELPGDCTPRHGFSTECGPGPSSGCACATPGSPARGTHGGWFSLALGVLGVAGIGGRRLARS